MSGADFPLGVTNVHIAVDFRCEINARIYTYGYSYIKELGYVYIFLKF